MTRKKLSGQTLVIIILTILLILALLFGGVYAYYSTKSVSITGRIVMANLKIDLNAGTKSELGLSGTNLVPNQKFENNPLVITNLSNTSIYVIIAYKVDLYEIDSNELAKDDEGRIKKDSYINPILDLNLDYYNPEEDIKIGNYNSDWIDYVFTREKDGIVQQYRCLVSPLSYGYLEGGYDIEVIPKDSFKLSRMMDNYYQNSSLYFRFQAFAIGADSFNFGPTDSKFDRCEQIISAIYESEGNKLLLY